MKIVIVDDERRARARLIKLLGAVPDVEIAGEAENGLEAIEVIETRRPDLVLLDVQMPGLSGFETVAALPVGAIPLVIFVTAYDQYAIKAFEISAVDYLLKPVSPERLDDALEKARDIIRTREPAAAALQQIQRLASALEKTSAPGPIRRVVGRRGRKIVVIPIEKVEAFIAEDELVFAITTEGKTLVNLTLKDLEEKLDTEQFARVHKRAIASLSHIVDIEPMFKGGAVANLKCGVGVDISRRYTVVLKEKLGW
ncbi:MAG TPA: response regulator [Blastocatellia bacterium]|nr:response regulator [Blastocatellia bacterium]